MPRRLRRLPLTVAAGVLFASTATFAALAQEGETPASDETFFESIDVSVVNVDVVVTDKTGHRVSGLTRDDFELREDGQPVAITNFYAVAGDVMTAGAEGRAAGAAAAAPAEATAVPEDQKLYLTLFIDNQNLPAASRNRLLPAIEKFLTTQLRPDAQVMLASYNGSLEIRQAPTAEAAAVVAQMEKIAKSAGRGTQALLERRTVLQQLSAGELENQDGAGSSGSGGRGERQSSAEQDALGVIQSIRSMAEKEYIDTRSTLASLSQLVDSLSGLPGRKVLLYVGGGMSLRPGEAMVRAFLNKYPRLASQFNVGLFDGFERDTGRMFEQLVAQANAHRVTFYTLAGSAEIGRASAEWGGDSLSYTSDLAAIDRDNAQGPMDTLAAGTGGLSFYDPADPGALMRRMQEDFGSYYSLGYVPRKKADGKTHHIQVIPRDRSLKVRHREGFRAQTPAERASSRTLAAAVLGVAQNPLEVALELEDETRDKRGNPVLSVLVKFPMAKLVLLPQEHVHEGRIKVFVAARDAEGRTSPITEMPVPIRIPNDQLMTALGQLATFRVQLAVRPGEQTIAVSVRDELGNSDSTVTTKYTAGTKVAARTGA